MIDHAHINEYDRSSSTQEEDNLIHSPQESRYITPPRPDSGSALETAPNTTEPVVYIRGTNWNATSISYTKRYENVHIQAINRVSPSVNLNLDCVMPTV
jgi:hypothetical protein